MAEVAARSDQFDIVEIFVLAWNRTGTLDRLERESSVHVHYALARSTGRGILPLIRFLMSRPFDFVFSSATHLNAISSAMRWLGLLRTKRLVTRESTVIFERDMGRGDILFRWLYLLYGSQDLVICQTERMRTSLSDNTNHRFDRKIRVVPNPIDLQRIETGQKSEVPAEVLAIPAERIRIVWCGRLSSVKAPMRAVDVLRLLHERGLSSTHLVVIGDGPLKDEMWERLVATGLTNYATLVGHLPNPIAAMAGGSLGLVTSDVEGFPNVILEMLAAGIPAIVTTNCAGDLSDLPKTFVSNGTDVQSIMQTVVRALSSPDHSDVTPFLEQRSPEEMLRNMMVESGKA
jgi:glycosyltransferase involved in cell wall biosynthesis